MTPARPMTLFTLTLSTRDYARASFRLAATQLSGTALTRKATTPRPSPRSAARAWLLALLLSLPAAAAAESPGAADPAAIDSAVAATLRSQGLTGATWALLDPVQGVRVGAAGFKDARTAVLLRPDDKVQVGSVTKTLLATGILRLVSTGRLRLDQPVAELLPAIAFDNPWAATDPPRLRHLLDHSAGLDDARLSQIFTRAPGPDTPLAEAFARDRGVLRVRSRPGTRTSYSNSGYTLLGMVIEAVTGERYERYLDRELLRPLGMRDSSFGYVSQIGPGADPRLAMGHFDDGSTHPTVPMFMRPGGQFSTTAADMARFARFLMSEGRIDGAAFVEPALLRGMGRPLDTEAARAGLRVGYAQGLMTRDRHGAVGLCHGGSTVGFRAMLCLFPQQQRAFFLAVNADNETADYGALDQRLIQALAVPTPTPAPMRPARLKLEEWEGYYVPSPNRMASFAWLDTTFGYVRVRRDGAGLRLTPLQGRQSELIPLGGALLRASDRLQASHALVIASDGARVIATGTQSYQRIARWKLLALWASLVAGGAGLLWLLARGLVRAARRRLRTGDALFAPWLAILALLLPLPWLYRQSFLQLGDLTVGSALLTAVTVILPAALLLGLWRYRRQRAAAAESRASGVDALAMAALLQWTAVLAAWGLWPVRLWA